MGQTKRKNFTDEERIDYNYQHCIQRIRERYNNFPIILTKKLYHKLNDSIKEELKKDMSECRVIKNRVEKKGIISLEINITFNEVSKTAFVVWDSDLHIISTFLKETAVLQGKPF